MADDIVERVCIDCERPTQRPPAYVLDRGPYCDDCAAYHASRLGMKREAELQAEITTLRADVAELLTMLQRTTGYLAWHANEDGPTDCPPCADMLAKVDALLAKHREG